MKLLYSAPFSGGSFTFFLPKGSYGGVAIAYRGTNTSTARTRSDLGTVQINWNGNPIVNVDVEMLLFLNNLKKGFSTFTSVANGLLNAFAFIPFGRFDDNINAYNLKDTDKVYVKCDYPNLTALSGNIFVYGIPKVGIQNYLYCLTNRNVVSGGASVISDVHRLPNIIAVYLKNPSAILDNLQLTRDNVNVADGLIQDIQAFSDFQNEVEASVELTEIDFNLSRDVREAISQEVQYKYAFKSAGTLQQYFAYAILTPSDAVRSAQEINQNLQMKVASGNKDAEVIPKVFVKEAETIFE